MHQPIGIFVAPPLMQSGHGAPVEVGFNAAIPYGRSDTLAAIYRPGESVPVFRSFSSPDVSGGGIWGRLWLRSRATFPWTVATMDAYICCFHVGFVHLLRGLGGIGVWDLLPCTVSPLLLVL